MQGVPSPHVRKMTFVTRSTRKKEKLDQIIIVNIFWMYAEYQNKTGVLCEYSLHDTRVVKCLLL